MILDLLTKWKANPKIFLISKDAVYTYDDLCQSVEALSLQLSKKFNVRQAFVLESGQDFESYVRFLTLLFGGHSILQCSSFHFSNDRFKKDLEIESQTQFLYWGKNQPFQKLEGNSKTSHQFLQRSLEESKAIFLVRTSGSSGRNLKLVAHDPHLFIQKYRKWGKHFDKTMAFSPSDSIAGIETLLEVVTHQCSLFSVGESFNPLVIADTIYQYKVDYLQTTPTFLNMMLISCQITLEKLNSLKKIAYGSEPAQEQVLLAIGRILPDMRFVHTYGMSEIGIQKTLTNPDNPSTFKLEPGYAEGRIVENMLEIKSPTCMLCYLNLQTDFTSDGWLRTNDIVQEESGYWKILGRSGDLINIAGRKFYPSELESIIMDMPELNDITIKVEKNNLVGHVLVAQIVLQSGMSEETFRPKFKEFCEKQIPDYMRPRRVSIVETTEFGQRFKKVR